MTNEKKPRVVDLTPRKKLIVSATKEQLSQIRKIVPSLKEDYGIKEINKNIYQLNPKTVKVNAPILLRRVTMNDMTKKEEKLESVDDFENSEDFYSEAKKSKGFKIVTDEYSDYRNINLYEGFNIIERNWRELVVKSLSAASLEKIPNPKDRYRPKLYNHKIAQYPLSEFFETVLNQPASKSYIKKYWRESKEKNEATVVKIADLKIMDEIEFLLNTDDLLFLKRARNACMHFNVITLEDYIQIIEKINDYRIRESFKEFYKVLNTSLKPIFKTFEDISETLAKLYKVNFPSL